MKWSNVVVGEELAEAVRQYLRESKVSFSTFIREAAAEYLRERGYTIEEDDVHPQLGGFRRKE